MTTNVPRIVGGDSYSPISSKLLHDFAASAGQSATFWLRYFNSVTAKGAEYRHAIENVTFRYYNTLVWPVARQTNHVGGSYQLGLNDGKLNLQDLIASFGEDLLSQQSTSILLDVEGSDPSHLSKDYYKGWVEGLNSTIDNRLSILPCVYGIPGDQITWNALDAATKEGIECHGVLLSRPYNNPDQPCPIPEPVQWNPSRLSLYKLKIPILGVQYKFGKTFDCDMLNPDEGDGSNFLKTLVLPSKL